MVRRYGSDPVFRASPVRRSPPQVPAEDGLVVEDPASGFCGAVVTRARDAVTLEDRHGRRRVFPLRAGGFLLEGRPVTLVPPPPSTPPPTRPSPSTSWARRTASGSVAVPGRRARVARAGRIYVEGVHDAALIERVWGDDLRIEGVVVEPLHGIDELAEVVRDFHPRRDSRLGVLVDHLVDGSKESRIVATVVHPDVLVTGHPYVDVWQAVRPAAVGIAAWPVVPRGQPWKEGVCRALGVDGPQEMWRRVLRAVSSYADLETPLLGAVERLIDFVTEPADECG